MVRKPQFDKKNKLSVERYMTMNETKTIEVLGAGESGVGAAILAADRGYEVYVSDSGAIAEKYRRILEA